MTVGTARILVFGCAGVGKSSLINLLAGEYKAEVGGGISGVTFESKLYHFTVGNISYEIIDTAGLNENENGRVSSSRALEQLMSLLSQNHTYNLGILVHSGRLHTTAFKANYEVFAKALLSKVNTICVYTHVDKELAQWKAANSRNILHHYRMLKDVVPVCTANPGQCGFVPEYFEKLRAQAYNNVLISINEHMNNPGIVLSRDVDLIGKIYNTFVEGAHRVGWSLSHWVASAEVADMMATYFAIPVEKAREVLAKGQHFIFN